MNDDERIALKAAQELAESDQLDKAYNIAERWLGRSPNNIDWLVCMQYIMMAAKKQSIAYHLGKRIVELSPNDAICWMNAGMAAADLWRLKEAERMFKRGLQVATMPHTKAKILTNWAATLIDHGQFSKAEKLCIKALENEPTFSKATANLGFTQLAQRKWKEGWQNYRRCIGSEFRPTMNYTGEPEWDGKGKGTIVIYAEQGIGDVISGGSLIPDMLEWCKANDSRIILDVDARLENLFKRSFPDATVYGTRESKDLTWDTADQKIDYSLPMLQLAEYFRTTTEEFPGTPYLTPDPDRALMWRSLFSSKGKPCIGIAWKGGIPRTGSRFRQLTLDQLYPILKSVDAHWVSLQYKDSSKEIKAFKEKHPEIDLVEYPHATQNKSDYDDTVALISALDHMVIMQTAAGHVAGAVGTPCWTFVPTNSQWRYGEGYEDFPWCKSVRLIRQNKRGEWDDVIANTAGELSVKFNNPRVPEATGKAPQQGKLRSNGAEVRRSRKRDNRQAFDQPSA